MNRKVEKEKKNDFGQRKVIALQDTNALVAMKNNPQYNKNKSLKITQKYLFFSLNNFPFYRSLQLKNLE